MITFDTAVLVKDNDINKKISMLNKVKSWASWVMLLYFPALFITVNYGENAQFYTSLALFIYLALWMIYSFIVARVVQNAREKQVLDSSATRDQLIESFGAKYNKLLKTNSIIIGIFALIAVASFIITVILAFTLTAGQEEVPAFAFPFIIIILISFFVGFLAPFFRQMRFASRELESISKLKNFMLQARGLTNEQISKQKGSIFGNLSDAQKRVSYLYPSVALRKKAQRARIFSILPSSFIASFLMGFLLVFTLNKNNYLGATLVIVGFIVVIATSIIIAQILDKKIHKQQYELFLLEPEKYKTHIELYILTTAYAKKSNKILGIFTAIIAVIFGTLAIFAPPQAKLGAIFIAIFIFFIGDIIILLSTHPTYRKKATPLEQQIESSILRSEEENNNIINQSSTTENIAETTQNNDTENATETTQNNDTENATERTKNS